VIVVGLVGDPQRHLAVQHTQHVFLWRDGTILFGNNTVRGAIDAGHVVLTDDFQFFFIEVCHKNTSVFVFLQITQYHQTDGYPDGDQYNQYNLDGDRYFGHICHLIVAGGVGEQRYGIQRKQEAAGCTDYQRQNQQGGRISPGFRQGDKGTAQHGDQRGADGDRDQQHENDDGDQCYDQEYRQADVVGKKDSYQPLAYSVGRQSIAQGHHGSDEEKGCPADTSGVVLPVQDADARDKEKGKSHSSHHGNVQNGEPGRQNP